jgi:hypothetical protein
MRSKLRQGRLANVSGAVKPRVVAQADADGAGGLTE